MNDSRMKDAELEAAITRALERKPEGMAPLEFAARVRAALPAQPKPRTRHSVAGTVAVVGAAALILAVCWLAPRAQPSFASMTFDLEFVMMVELAGVAAWLGTRRSDD